MKNLFFLFILASIFLLDFPFTRFGRPQESPSKPSQKPSTAFPGPNPAGGPPEALDALNARSGADLKSITLIKVSRVLDSGTLEATILLPWKIQLNNRIIRILDYEPYSLSPYSGISLTPEDELLKANEAKLALTKLVKEAKYIYASPPSASSIDDYDNYGRLLAYIYLVNSDSKIIDLSKYMKDNNLVKYKTSTLLTNKYSNLPKVDPKIDTKVDTDPAKNKEEDLNKRRDRLKRIQNSSNKSKDKYD